MVREAGYTQWGDITHGSRNKMLAIIFYCAETRFSIFIKRVRIATSQSAVLLNINW